MVRFLRMEPFYSNDLSSPKKSCFQILATSVKTVWTHEEITLLPLPILCKRYIQLLNSQGVMKKVLWAFFWYENLRRFEKIKIWGSQTGLPLKVLLSHKTEHCNLQGHISLTLYISALWTCWTLQLGMRHCWPIVTSVALI